MNNLAQLQRWLPRMMWLCALCGLAINGLLLGKQLAGGAIAGCGGGGSCDALLSSRWSQVLGVPVTAAGCLVYMILLFALTNRGRRLLLPCVGVVAGAAVWFVLLQAFIIGRFCPWCLGAHAIAATLAVLAVCRKSLTTNAAVVIQSLVLYAGTSAAAISLAQVLGPKPVTHQIAPMHPVMVDKEPRIHARGVGRKVSFNNGQLTYAVAELPHLGPVDAPHVMIEYFDYSCASCRTMRGYLAKLLEKHHDSVCVVVLPVPMERSCNPAMGPGHPEYRGACEMARLALAVWRAAPGEFVRYHASLLTANSADEARAAVLKIMPPDKLDAALRDPWIDELLRANIADWKMYSAETDKLPKLLISDKRILNGLPSDEDSFVSVIERELQLKPGE